MWVPGWGFTKDTIRFLLGLPTRSRRLLHCHRLHRVLPEIQESIAEFSRILYDIQLDRLVTGAVIIQYTVARAQVIFERFFPGKEVFVTVWTVDIDDDQYLRPIFNKAALPASRGSVAEKLKIKECPCWTIVDGKSEEPFFISNTEKYQAPHIDSHAFADYRKRVGSLALCVIRVNERTLGVLKIESKHRNVLVPTPSSKYLMKIMVTLLGTAFAVGFRIAQSDTSDTSDVESIIEVQPKQIEGNDRNDS